MSNDRPIVIKKVKKVSGGGHHGGAWKVAYADFVTAMMAFFLLMWLISTSTPEQKRGIADYFAPASVSASSNGSGGILGGTALGQDGIQGRGSSSVVERISSETSRDSSSQDDSNGTPRTSAEVSADAMAAAMARREDAMLQSAEMSLRQAMQDMPELAELSKHVIIDLTPDGLRIQLIDQEGRPMFEAGSAEPTDRAKTLLRAIAPVIARLPNRLKIAGHTDSSPAPLAGYSNWELSSDRANATRRLLEESALSPDRIFQVAGKAGSEPLFPDEIGRASCRERV